MSIGTAWIIALLPAFDREELRRFVAPWADGRRSRSREMPWVLLDVGRSAGVANSWLWECTWRVGSSRVASVPALDRESPLGYAPPHWSEPARSDATLRPDAELSAINPNAPSASSVPGVVMDMGFGLPLPCMGMRAELPNRHAGFNDWEWTGSIGVVPLPPDSSPTAMRGVRTHSLGRLPLAPMWAGLAVNSVCWAAVLGGAMWARRRLVWMAGIMRRETGRCAECGYEMARARAASCPECGAARGQPVSNRTVAALAGIAALGLFAMLAVCLVRGVPVNWSAPAAALLWPAIAAVVVSVLLLGSAWGAVVAPHARGPHAVVAVCLAVVSTATLVWAATISMEAAQNGRAAAALVAVASALAVVVCTRYAQRRPRSGGMLLVWSASTLSAAVAAWGALAVVMSASDFSAVLNLDGWGWWRIAPTFALVAGAFAGTLVHAVLSRVR